MAATALATSVTSWGVRSLSPGTQFSVIRNALAPTARPGSTAPPHFGPSSLKPKKKPEPACADEAAPQATAKSAGTTSEARKRLRPPFKRATVAPASPGGLSLRRRLEAPERGVRYAGFRLVDQADARTRTGDPFITSEVLYQLSYVGGSSNCSRLADR